MICVFNHDFLRSVHRFFNHCSCLSPIDNALSQFYSDVLPHSVEYGYGVSLITLRRNVQVKQNCSSGHLGLSYTKSRPKGGYVGSVTRVILLFLTSCCANIKMPVSEEAHATLVYYYYPDGSTPGRQQSREGKSNNLNQ